MIACPICARFIVFEKTRLSGTTIAYCVVQSESNAGLSTGLTPLQSTEWSPLQSPVATPDAIFRWNRNAHIELCSRGQVVV